MSDLPLITKYRPEDFDEIVGHYLVKTALERAISNPSRPHAFLATGPTGIGKTTIARIIAKRLKAEVIEIDAASNNGVDAMRALVDLGNHMSLGGAGTRMFIIDECHALSKPAWQAILKLLEEPPSHLFLALCTTELAKVPDTIISRCYHIVLRNLSPNEIDDLLSAVITLEKWDVADDVVSAVIQAADGSPRRALNLLHSVHDAEDREEVRRIISLTDTSEPVLEICRHIISGKTSWKPIQAALAKMSDDDIDSAVSVIGRYIASVMKKAETDAKAKAAWQLLNALTFPTETWDKRVSFYAVIGRMLWGKEI